MSWRLDDDEVVWPESGRPYCSYKWYKTHEEHVHGQALTQMQVSFPAVRSVLMRFWDNQVGLSVLRFPLKPLKGDLINPAPTLSWYLVRDRMAEWKKNELLEPTLKASLWELDLISYFCGSQLVHYKMGIVSAFKGLFGESN